MNKRWIVVACGAALIVGIPNHVRAADAATGLEVRAEVRAGFVPSRFPGSASSRIPFVVPLREAWESGANSWSATRRASFARSATARSAVIGLSAKSNAERGDRDPAQWLPASASRCAYVAKWIAVKIAFGLSADAAEVARLRRLLADCAPSTTVVTTVGPSIKVSTTTTAVPVPSVTLPSTATSTTAITSTSQGSTAVTTSGNNALDLLASVRITPEYITGYDRDLFKHWTDDDRDGCDTRAEVLMRDTSLPTTRSGSCTIRTGRWTSPYDGQTWTNASDIDIDHVVALNEAWQSGAYAWTPQRRQDYANDLSDARTLLAVTDSVNQSKSDKDPTEWLPPLASYRCTYLAYWVAVKARWSLAMDEAEFAAVRSGLAGCGA